jgi:hypothetical protein
MVADERFVEFIAQKYESQKNNYTDSVFFKHDNYTYIPFTIENTTGKSEEGLYLLPSGETR